MNTFPRFTALFVVAFSSASLVACASPTESPDDSRADAPEVTETAAQPLLISCDGTYTRPSDDGKGLLKVDLVRNDRGICTVAGYHLGNDHIVSAVIGGKPFRGTWEGDATSFVMCTDAHCVQWTRSVAANER
jgi:hypothetical protein